MTLSIFNFGIQSLNFSLQSVRENSHFFLHGTFNSTDKLVHSSPHRNRILHVFDDGFEAVKIRDSATSRLYFRHPSAVVQLKVT
jgi:hypothetical protein